MSRPRVLIDARTIGPIPHGFARYVTRLAEGLANESLPYEVAFILSQRIFDERSFPAVFARFPLVPARVAIHQVGELLEVPRILRREGAALYHSPTFSSLIGSPCPWVQTIHDLNHRVYGGWKEKIYYEAVLKPFARKARKLITVSEFSRREIAAWLKLDEESIAIAQNALDPSLGHAIPNQGIRAVLAEFGLVAGKYFFCLSNSKPHKNTAMLLEAYSRLRIRQPQAWPLVLSLSGPASDAGVQMVGGLDDHQTRALLEGAGAVVFPSLYEGFGLPPLEAAALGRPVLVSDIPPHHEALVDLAPDEATWISPADRQGWVDAMIQTQAAPKAVSGASRERILRRYSAGNLGKRMDRIYREALNEVR